MPKRSCLGCAFPVIIGLGVVILVLFVLGFLSGPIGKGLIGDVGLPSWLSVPQPHPELPAAEIFSLGGIPISNTIFTAWITIVVLAVVMALATRGMKLVPTSKMQMMVEAVFGWLLGFCEEVAGEKNGRRFFPIVATIFLFVIANAWLSLLPGFNSIMVTNPLGEEVHLLRGANTDMNFPLALALVSFIAVGYYGFRSMKLSFLGQYFAFGRLGRALGDLFRGKVKQAGGQLFSGIIDIFVGALELLSVFIRILSFTFRLFGNMTAGEILILMMMFLVPWVAALPFYGLELLVGYIQALIFAGLTLVFLTVAVTHHE